MKIIIVLTYWPENDFIACSDVVNGFPLVFLFFLLSRLRSHLIEVGYNEAMKNGLLICPSNVDSYKEAELKELMESALVPCVQQVFYNPNQIRMKSLLGTGKIAEVQETLAANPEIDTIIIGTPLSPLQARELEAAFNLPVLDSTDLILNIFSLRAQTKEAKLQVESALLKRKLNRLSGFYTHLDRQGGAGQNRGAGEKKIVLDKRQIQLFISQNKKELQKIENQKNVQAKSRKNSSLPIVALAGYTNAGKSTIMNKMLEKSDTKTQKQVYAEDQLFATLDSFVRLIEVDPSTSFLLVDTVGFIQDLPHDLIEGFKSTLSNLKDADLILEIVDAANENHLGHLETVAHTFESIGVSQIPTLQVFNKCDLANFVHPEADNDRIFISAKEESDIDFLIQQIIEHLYGKEEITDIILPFDQMHQLYQIQKLAKILQEKELEDGVLLTISYREKNLPKLAKFLNQN